MRTELLILGGLLLVSACRLGVAPEGSAAVSSLRFAPSAFDSFKRNAELRYTLGAPAQVRVLILRRDGAGGEALVKVLGAALRETKGSHAITWLGDTSEHLFAPAGTYIGAVECGGARFETPVEVFHF